VQMSVEEGLGRKAQACRALDLGRSSYYRSSVRRTGSLEKQQQIRALSERHPRYGYRRITAVLKRGGMKVNAKRVQRVRRVEGLQVSRKQRRMKRVGVSTSQRQRAMETNAVWSWDFVHDQTEGGGNFRILTLLDEYSRRCLAVHVGRSIRAVDVITVVEAAFARYGKPQHLRSDNGPEFIAYAVQDWLEDNQVKTMYIKPGSPWENGHIESFHDKLRDECLNRELFGSLREAQVVIEGWRCEYNQSRPHSSLGYQTPDEYASRQTNQVNGGYAPPIPAPLAAAGVWGNQGAIAPVWQLTKINNQPMAELQF
jgi:transposase InsO family protein